MKSALLGSLFLLGSTLPALGEPPPPVTCDRNCLDGFVDRYLDAMQAHAA